MKQLIRKLAWQLGGRRREAEIQEELEFHIEAETRELRNDGVAPATARGRARKAFGNMTRHHENTRAAWGWSWIEGLVQDLRYAARSAWAHPLFTLLAIMPLALGIGANTALFSLLDTLALSKLEVPEPDGLVTFHWVGPNNVRGLARGYGVVSTDGQAGAEFSYRVFQQFQAANRTLTGLAAFAPADGINVVVDGVPDVIAGQYVSGAYYDVLGVRPFAGRLLSDADDRPGSEPVVVLSHRYWTRRFAQDPDVVGKSFLINGLSFTVVGVAPEGLTDPAGMGQSDPAVQMPLAVEARLPKTNLTLLDRDNAWWLLLLGRRGEGVGLQQVEANFVARFRETASTEWDLYRETDAAIPPTAEALIPDLRAVDGTRGVFGMAQPILLGIGLAGALFLIVLLVVCLNLASLLISRLAARQQEFAVRGAIGAGPGRLRRQLLTEHAFLALIGGAIGLLVAHWLLGLLPALLPTGVRATVETQLNIGRMDPPVFLFSFLLALTTVLVFGGGPSLGVSRTFRVPTTRSSSGDTRTRARLGRRLLTVEVALSLLLLVGAGLCVRTLANLRRAPVGFDPADLLVFTTNPRFAGYGEELVEAQAVYSRILDELRATPGVRDVSLSGFAPISGSTRRQAMFLPGRDSGPSLVATLNVHPGFFRALGIPLIAGRAFDEADGADAPQVAVVNQAFARTYLPEAQGIGSRFGYASGGRTAVEVVGIVADTGYASVREPATPVVYTADAQRALGSSSRTFEVRTVGPPGVMASAVRTAVTRVDPRLPILDLGTFTDNMERGFAAERIFAWVTTVFAGLAVLLSMTGLFGLASYTVTQRTREIGIRMALGAARGTVLSETILAAIRPVAIGVALGIAGALAMTPVIGSLVFGMAPYDPWTIGGAAVLMFLVAGIAAAGPARRAARIDPTVALRYE